MARDSKTINVAFDFLCFILVLIDYLVTKTLVYGTTDKLYPIKQGFFCEDKSIQLPFKEPWMDYAGLCALVYIVPIVVILIVESCNNWKRSGEIDEEEEESFGPITIKPWIVSTIALIFVFVFGGFLNEIITDLAKISVGRLRPNFRDVCRANLTQSDCQQGYISDGMCTGDEYNVKMARMSFPSGQSSLTMYAMLYLAFYIQSAVKTETKLIKPLLQIVVVSLALFLGLSRIAENAHFLSDIVAGFVLGAIIAWLMTFKVLKLFAIRIRKPKVYTLLPQQSRQISTED